MPSKQPTSVSPVLHPPRPPGCVASWMAAAVGIGTWGCNRNHILVKRTQPASESPSSSRLHIAGRARTLAVRAAPRDSRRYSWGCCPRWTAISLYVYIVGRFTIGRHGDHAGVHGFLPTVVECGIARRVSTQRPRHSVPSSHGHVCLYGRVTWFRSTRRTSNTEKAHPFPEEVNVNGAEVKRFGAVY